MIEDKIKTTANYIQSLLRSKITFKSAVWIYFYFIKCLNIDKIGTQKIASTALETIYYSTLRMYVHM